MSCIGFCCIWTTLRRLAYAILQDTGSFLGIGVIRMSNLPLEPMVTFKSSQQFSDTNEDTQQTHILSSEFTKLAVILGQHPGKYFGHVEDKNISNSRDM